MIPSASGGLERPRLVVHIGWDPAGAAIAQRAFARNFTTLSSHHILYPSTGRTPGVSTGHRMLRAMITGELGNQAWQPSASEFVDALAAEIEFAGARSVLLCDQELVMLREADVATFGSVFSSFAITPVVAVSSFALWLEHRYASMVMEEGVTATPSTSMIPGTLVKRLAAWAAIAADGHLGVVDVDAGGTERVVTALLRAAGAGDPPAVLPCEPGPPEVPAPPVVALVRQFRLRGVSEKDLQGLADQLGAIDFTEPLTNVPAALAAALDERYAAFLSRLRRATFTRWVEPATDAAPAARPDMILVKDEIAAVFAIGRAIATSAYGVAARGRPT